MKNLRLARVLLAVGLLGLGSLSLWYDDFALNWQPVPADLPGRGWLAYLSGLILVAGGFGLLFGLGQRAAAFLLAGFVTSWLVLLQLPRVVSQPMSAFMWLGFGENLLLVAGAWAVAMTTGRSGGGSVPRVSEKWIKAARLGFGMALPMVGWSHFVYVKETAAMVPGWLPWHPGFAYFTGAAHILAGVGVVFSLWPRIAATLETVMIGCFLVLIHWPAVLHAPSERLPWTMALMATAYCGAAWAIAGTYASAPGLDTGGTGRKA